MHVLSLVWGILSILGFGVAIFPCLGSLNWVNIPFSLAGLVIGIVASSKPPAEKKGQAVAGIVLCSIAVVAGFIRLVAGGGIL